MLNELRRITSSEPYKSSGSMRVREILIRPWDTPDTKFVFDIWADDNEDGAPETWEIICSGLAQTKGIPQAIIARTRLELFENHRVLWNFADEIYFSVTTKTESIAALMGELFIEHTKACGNWVDFNRLYSGLPTTLESLRKNQIAIPIHLKNACFEVLEKHGVKYHVNTIQQNSAGYKVLFFSTPNIWPNEENFGQPHIIAKEFSEMRLS